ncbi:MAG: ATP-dependent DNA ligase [Akkermansiaceae bacterium]
MIEVIFNRGLYLPEMDFWLDPWDAKESAFVSHAHADHFSRHENILCSDLTAKLLKARFEVDEGSLEATLFGTTIEKSGFRMRMLPAGHIVGSAMLHITRKADGKTLLYTGDFKARRGRTTEQVNFIHADCLIMETTFALPNLIFPGPMEVDAAILGFVHDTLADGEIPVLLGYSLGKAQEVIALLSEHEIPVLSHPKVAEMTEACIAAGLNLPEPEVFEGKAGVGSVIVAPPNSVRSKLLRNLKGKRTAMLSGWALNPGSQYRYRVDEVIPMSDHADYVGLMECVTRVRPRRVLTVHGYAKEFAADLRNKGYDAWCAMGGDQLELSIEKPKSGVIEVGVARHTRPVCEFADFSDVCRLIGETSSRIEKISYLVAYLKGLDIEHLPIVVRWFGGELFPRHEKSKTMRIGSAAIKRSLLEIPDLKKERYLEVSKSQNDIARTTRILLQEIHYVAKPLTINEVDQNFRKIEKMEGVLGKIQFLSKRLIESHPFEAESLVKLLTGDLRIGLKEGLVEEAIGLVFSSPMPELRKANMFLGDLGETAVLAKEGNLSEAKLTPMIPVRCMLASPIEQRNIEDDSSAFTDLPVRSNYWLEPKYDGIRVQLHKSQMEVGLFSRDLRPLNEEFPELIAAAKKLDSDFVIDGELIAYSEGRKLGFSDLQKRLGRKRSENDLFMVTSIEGVSVPLKLVAFDALWVDGVDLLNLPLDERRTRLDGLGFEGLFCVIEVFRAKDLTELERFFKQSLQERHEGLILKEPKGFYTPGRRGKSWLKLKGVMPTLDCVVVKAEQGHGKRSDMISDYTFAVKDEESGDLKILGKAYSGLTDLEIEELTEHFIKFTLSKERRKRIVEPNIVLEIAFDSIRRSSRHDSGLALRFPRIKAIRRDKTLEDIDTLKTAENLLKK